MSFEKKELFDHFFCFRLEKFCVAISDAGFFKEGKMTGVRNRCQGWANKRLDAWEKCGFYSAEVKHGGPDPNVAYKPTKRSHWGGQKEKVVLEPEENQRKRRDADCEWDGTFLTFIFHLIFLSKI